MPVVHFVNEKKEIEVPRGANLRKEALKAGIRLYPGVHRLLNCHGFAQCGSCRVRILKGQEHASRMRFFEKMRLRVSMAFIGNEETMRLSCQTQVMGDMTVETKPPLDLYGENFFS